MIFFSLTNQKNYKSKKKQKDKQEEQSALRKKERKKKMPTEQSEIKFTEVKDVSADSIMTLNEPIYKTLVKK